MKRLAVMLGVSLVFSAVLVTAAEEKESPVYEMRIYQPADGKLEALHDRFRDHTLKLLEKHDILSVGYWTPLDKNDQRLVFLLAYPSREAREKSWNAFAADPAWQKAKAESEKDGVLVTKVESQFLVATDYSPELKIEPVGNRVFELRHYTTTPGNLAALDARFRNHTLKLFAKHGMTNVLYLHLMKDQPGADNTLIYFLAHDSEAAGKASFDSFRTDPDWIAARQASEEKAGGSLTAEGGVKSLYLAPTDYSPLK